MKHTSGIRLLFRKSESTRKIVLALRTQMNLPSIPMANPNPRTLTPEEGAKGGRAKNAKLTPEERSAAARHAVNARWAKVRKAKAKKVGATQ